MNDSESYRYQPRSEDASEQPHPSAATDPLDAKIVLGDSMPSDANMPILQESQILSEVDLTAIDLNLNPPPVLTPHAPSSVQPPSFALVQADPTQAAMSKIEPGLSFEGNAVIAGSLTLAGHLTGNVHCTNTDNSEACSVVVTETGYLMGDVTAQFISVMGQSNGLLNASGGKVELHRNSSIAGHVRYKHLMVNGALLNATLECVNNA